MCFVEVIDTAGQGVPTAIISPRSHVITADIQRSMPPCGTSGSGAVSLIRKPVAHVSPRTTEKARDLFSSTRSPQGLHSSALRSSIRPCSRSRDINRYSCSSVTNATNNTSAKCPEKKALPLPITSVADFWKHRPRRLRMWRNCSQI